MSDSNLHAVTRPFTADEAAFCEGELPPGTEAGAYRVLRSLARGGCGWVYEAEHRSSGARAAVKVLHRALACSPGQVRRFAREVDLVRRIGHPSIVEIYEIGALEDGRPFFAMELLEGDTLDELLETQGRLEPAEALALLEPIGDALAAAHGAGVVHRDVTARNVLVSSGPEGRRVKLLDFGIAKLVGPTPDSSGLTSMGRIGTPLAMSPEQILGHAVDARADVYALGVLLHRMLTGSFPFSGRNAGELVRQHLEDPAPRPSEVARTPAALDAIVLRCLEKRRERRYPSVAALLEALREVIAPPSRAQRELDRARRLALGVRVEIDPDALQNADTEGVERAFRALDGAERSLSGAGLNIVLSTASGVLGVLPLPEPGEASRAAARRAFEVAAALESTAVPPDGGRLSLAVTIHAGEILVEGATAIAGGALATPATWPPAPRPGVFVSPEALAVAGFGGATAREGREGRLVALEEARRLGAEARRARGDAKSRDEPPPSQRTTSTEPTDA